MESIPGAVRICAPPVSDLLGESNGGVGTVWTFVRYNVPRARAKPLSYQWRRILVGNFTSPISRNNNIPRLARTSIVCCSASNATRLQCSLEACVWRASQIARARASRPPHSGRAPGHPDTSWVDLSKGVLVVLVVKFRVCWCAAQACTAVHSQPPTPEWSRN